MTERTKAERVKAAVNRLMDVGDGVYGPAPSWATGPLAATRFLVIAGKVADEFGLTVEELAAGCAEFIGARLGGRPC